MKKVIYLFLYTFVATLSGCNDDEWVNTPIERQDITLSTRSKVLNEKVNEFTLTFFQQHHAAETKSNFMVSPFSLSMALAMTANGAKGNTLEEMLKVLGFEDSSVDELNEYYRTMMKSLPQLDNTVNLSMANSIWAAGDLQVKKNFVEANQRNYDAEVRTIDFSAAGTLQTINGWIAKKTNDCIPELLKILDASTRMMLINALYFKGSWTSKFDKSGTRKKEFTHWDGTKSKIDMMHQKKVFSYAYNDTFEMLELPYGNQAFSMKILLPYKLADFNDAAGKLDLKMLKSLKNQTLPLEVDVELPKFELKYETNWGNEVQAMGIKQAFSDHADFSDMTAENLSISEIKQGTCLRVDEEGMEAAAETATMILGEAGHFEPPTPVFHVDRPFLFVMEETSTGAILFIGKVISL